MKNRKRPIALLLILSSLLLCFSACSSPKPAGDAFYAGYAQEELAYGSMSDYYIAGYKGGRHPTGVLDPQLVKAVWLDNGSTSVLMITVDCVALDSKTVNDIRSELSAFSKESGCDSVNVISTHTHAGVDTLGLWGPVGINGKNESFNKQIIQLACKTAEQAYANRSKGTLFYSATETENLQQDSRSPQVYDKHLYQLRFQPDQANKAGIRLVSFAAHAESLRGKNLMISADFPAALSKRVQEACGDRLMFLPGAIGGLIMTPELTEGAVANMELTAEKLADYVLFPTQERKLTPTVKTTTVKFRTKLENTLFIYYKFLGILGNEVQKSPFGGYELTTELSLIHIGDVTLSLFPGEVFPELINGEGGLAELAEKYGLSTLIPIGLANDEIGYIIPEKDFVLNKEAPYVKKADGHYEETNSVGPRCAADLIKAFEKAAQRIAE